jgi:hypothetical protein
LLLAEIRPDLVTVQEFVGLSSDKLLMQNRLHENRGKKNENFISSLLVRPLAANKGHYSRFHSKSAGGFAVSSLSDT